MLQVLTLVEASAETGLPLSMLRRAIHATDPEAPAPPLSAKRGPRGAYLILARDLEDWLERLPDA